jgi:serine/threonine protein kinase
LSHIGSGGFGSVLRAFDLQEQKTVALKLILTLSDPDALPFRRFEREVQVMAELSHPNIVPVLGNHLIQSPPFVVLEFINGEALTKHLGAGLSRDNSLLVLRQVAQALDYAHQHGIIHRDIKPGNIVLEEQGFPSPKLHAWVIDFGILRVWAGHGEEPGKEYTALTRSNTTVGTPQYMAPEQWSNKNVGPWADLYSLGVVAHEMLLGSLPFKEQSVLGLYRAHTEQKVSLPDADAWGTPLLPAHLSAFHRCLSKDPGNRQGSCMEFMEEITDAYESEKARTQTVHKRPEAQVHPRNTTKRILSSRWIALLLTAVAIFGVYWLRPNNPLEGQTEELSPLEKAETKSLSRSPSPRRVEEAETKSLSRSPSPRRVEEAELRIPREQQDEPTIMKKGAKQASPPLRPKETLKARKARKPVEPRPSHKEDFKVEQFLD